MTTTPATPVTTSDLAEALREAIANTEAVGWLEDPYPEYDYQATDRWQSLLDRYDAQPTTNPATDHVKEYDPDAWRNATHAAALHFWGMEYYEHDPAKLMEAVSAALYFLAPAIVRQVREENTRHIAKESE